MRLALFLFGPRTPCLGLRLTTGWSAPVLAGRVVDRGFAEVERQGRGREMLGRNMLYLLCRVNFTENRRRGDQGTNRVLR